MRRLVGSWTCTSAFTSAVGALMAVTGKKPRDTAGRHLRGGGVTETTSSAPQDSIQLGFSDGYTVAVSGSDSSAIAFRTLADEIVDFPHTPSADRTSAVAQMESF